MISTRIPPYGGLLVDLLAADERSADLRRQFRSWPSSTLSARQLCSLELLITGAFSPLRGFMGRRDYDAVTQTGRLSDSTLWPVPIVMDVDDATARMTEQHGALVLRDEEGRALAALHVDDVWTPSGASRVCIGGRVEAIERPIGYGFPALRRTPAQVRADLESRAQTDVLGYHPVGPFHRADVEETCSMLDEIDGHLLLLPVVGPVRPGDSDHYVRVRCYQAAPRAYPANRVTLALLPLAPVLESGACSAAHATLCRAIVARNFGCTHAVRGADQEDQYDAELGIKAVRARAMAFVPARQRFVRADRLEPDTTVARFSSSDLAAAFENGDPVPDWFSFPDVLAELRRVHVPRGRQGFTVFFTGLSGAGKSTIANVLAVRLSEIGGRVVSLLDGDLVRRHLTSELGFSKAHRDLNVRRIGFVASEVTRCGGAALCAAIAPYDEARRGVRAMIQASGGFVLVHVATPISICEARDRKGLYAKARAGTLEHFTGISDPYEVPTDAEIVIDATNTTPEAAADRIIAWLTTERYLV
jgi:sulfate adenylyltransferase